MVKTSVLLKPRGIIRNSGKDAPNKEGKGRFKQRWLGEVINTSYRAVDYYAVGNDLSLVPERQRYAGS
ncbi:hypothetical protein CSW98_01360 [Vibrio sp. HA2012]|nr:hypothetical protein CSW98_01360 [Vibrio sp. HA2012]